MDSRDKTKVSAVILLMIVIVGLCYFSVKVSEKEQEQIPDIQELPINANIIIDQDTVIIRNGKIVEEVKP